LIQKNRTRGKRPCKRFVFPTIPTVGWKGAVKGLAQKDSIFNEAIEKKWVEQCLFFANSTRYASAIAGADYGVFANGRWYMSKNIQEMIDWLGFKLEDKN